VKEGHAANVDAGEQDLPPMFQQTMERAPPAARSQRPVVVLDELLGALAPHGYRMGRMNAPPNPGESAEDLGQQSHVRWSAHDVGDSSRAHILKRATGKR